MEWKYKKFKLIPDFPLTAFAKKVSSTRTGALQGQVSNRLARMGRSGREVGGLAAGLLAWPCEPPPGGWAASQAGSSKHSWDTAWLAASAEEGSGSGWN